MTTQNETRKKTTVYVKPELDQWVEEQIKKGKFKNFSHTVDVALEKLRDSQNSASPQKT